MKRINNILIIMIFIIGCSNKKESGINLEQMEEELLNSQNTYSTKPYYSAKIQAQDCYYEVFINEMPVASFGTLGGISNEVPLNYDIVKSGKQILRVKLTPMSNALKLSKEVDFKILIGFNNIIGEKELGEYTKACIFDLPKTIKDNDLPFFEIEIPFEGIVPWNYSQNYENAQDLKSNPKINLLVDNLINKLHKTLVNKDQKTFNSLYINNLKREVDVMYSTPKEIKGIVHHMNLSKVKSVLPIPDYEIIFYGNGKLVRAISKQKDEYGNRYVIKYKVAPLRDGGEDGESAENQIFYLPKGKTELEFF